MRVGLQMYSVRTEMALDPVSTVKAVTAMGYRYLEWANLTADVEFGVGFGVDADELREVLQHAGAESLGVHAWPLTLDNVDSLISYHQRLGTTYIVSKMIPDRGETLQTMAITLSRVGEAIRGAGMQHLLHTSLMRREGERTDLDEILDRVDEELVNVELDIYWAYRSGLDPVRILQRYGDRIRVLHQKDAPATMAQPRDIVGALEPSVPLTLDVYWDSRYVAPENFVEVGTGILPVRDYVDAALKNPDCGHLLVEQDFTVLSELESVRISMRNLREIPGLDWS